MKTCDKELAMNNGTRGFLNGVLVAAVLTGLGLSVMHAQRLDNLERIVKLQEHGEQERVAQVWRAIEVIAVAVGVDPHNRPAHAERLVKAGPQR